MDLYSAYRADQIYKEYMAGKSTWLDDLPVMQDYSISLDDKNAFNNPVDQVLWNFIYHTGRGSYFLEELDAAGVLKLYNVARSIEWKAKNANLELDWYIFEVHQIESEFSIPDTGIDILDDAVDATIVALDDLAGWAENQFGDVFDAIADAAETLYNDVISVAVDTFVDGLSDVAGAAFEAVSSAIEDTGLAAAVSDLADGISDVAADVADGVEGGFNDAIEAAGDGADFVSQAAVTALAETQAAMEEAAAAVEAAAEFVAQLLGPVWYGDNGNDRVFRAGPVAYMYAKGGNDTVTGAAAHVKIRGGAGNDTLNGLGAYNDIDGGSGNDRIYAIGGGNDLKGGDGNDLLTGVGASNKLDGGDGNDRFVATGGHNEIRGGSGDDTVLLGLGVHNDIVTDGGNDSVNAMGGSNAVNTGNGNDQIRVGGVANYVRAGDGFDWIWVFAAANVVSAGDGYDIVYAVGGSNILVNGNDGGSIHALGAANWILSGNGGDHISALGGGNFVFSGGAGEGSATDHDTITVGGLANVVFAGHGSNTVTALGGGNFIFGGDGSDVFYLGGAALNVAYAGNGHNTVTAASGGANIVFGGDGRDIVTLVAAGNLMVLGDGNNVAIGLGGANVVWSGSGNDTVLLGGLLANVAWVNGGDNLVGVAGTGNLVVAGDGDDTLVAAGLKANIILAGGGDNTVVAISNYNFVSSEGGEDTIVALGTGNAIVAGDGNNLVVAVGQANGVVLGDGNDTAVLLARGNVVSAGDGNNTIVVVADGNAVLAGGGNDVVAATGKANFVSTSAGDDVALVLGRLNLVFTGAGDDVGLIIGDYNAVASGDGDDILISKGKLQVVLGEANSDIIVALGETNILAGGEGNDVILAMGKSNWVLGGSGSDILIVSGKWNLVAADNEVNADENTLADLKAWNDAKKKDVSGYTEGLLSNFPEGGQNQSNVQGEIKVTTDLAFLFPDLQLTSGAKDWESPSFTLPSYSWDLPDIPEYNFPSELNSFEDDVDLPDYGLPELGLPKIQTPTLQLPSITVPDIKLPSFKEFRYTSDLALNLALIADWNNSDFRNALGFLDAYTGIGLQDYGSMLDFKIGGTSDAAVSLSSQEQSANAGAIAVMESDSAVGGIDTAWQAGAGAASGQGTAGGAGGGADVALPGGVTADALGGAGDESVISGNAKLRAGVLQTGIEDGLWGADQYVQDPGSGLSTVTPKIVWSDFQLPDLVLPAFTFGGLTLPDGSFGLDLSAFGDDAAALGNMAGLNDIKLPDIPGFTLASGDAKDGTFTLESPILRLPSLSFAGRSLNLADLMPALFRPVDADSPADSDHTLSFLTDSGDLAIVHGEQNQVFLGDGGDIALNLGKENVLFAGNGNDLAMNLVPSLDGNNHMRGGAGNDILVNIGKKNKMKGDDGDDILLSLTPSSIADAENEIKGSNGNDAMLAVGKKNKVMGEAGDDVGIAIGNENEMGNSMTLEVRGLGDDTYVAIGNKNRLWMGAGNDVAFTFGNQNYLWLEDGDDLAIAIGRESEIIGDEGDDLAFAIGRENHLAGDSGNDQLFAFGASNNLHGGIGDDVLAAAGLNSKIFAGSGSDLIFLAAQQAYAFGGDGDDTIFALGGLSNYIAGNAGNDAIYVVGNYSLIEADLPTDGVVPDGFGPLGELGDDGHDTVFVTGNFNGVVTGGGDDFIVLFGEGNFVKAGSNADVILAYGVHSIAEGQDGHDLVFAGSVAAAARVTGDGGSGDDLLVAHGKATARLLSGDSLPGIDSAVADAVSARAVSQILLGADGATAGAILNGGSGNDTLVSGDGEVLLRGGEGNDTYLVLADSGTTTIIETGEGQDTLRLVLDQGEVGILTVSMDATGVVSLTVDGETRVSASIAEGEVEHLDLAVGGTVIASLDLAQLHAEGAFTVELGVSANANSLARSSDIAELPPVPLEVDWHTLWGWHGFGSPDGWAGEGTNGLTQGLFGNASRDILLMTDGRGEALGKSGDDVLVAYGYGLVDLLEDGEVNGTGLRLSASAWETVRDLVADATHPNAGGRQDSTLKGGTGDDVLIGGVDLDTLIGGAGDDTYIYYLGGNEDRIIADGGGNDVLEIRTGPWGEQEGWTLSLDQLRPWIEGDDLHIGVSAALGYHAEIVVQDWETSDIRELRLVNGDVMLTYDFQSVFAGVDAESGESTAHSRTWRKNWFDRVEDALVGIEAPAPGNPDAHVKAGSRDILLMTDGRGEALGKSGDDVLVAYGYGLVDLLEDGEVNGTGLRLSASAWETVRDLVADATHPNAGGRQDSTLKGGTGDDVLIGGVDLDTLIGGAGDDTYIYYLGGNEDRIIADGGGNDVLEIRTGPWGEQEGWTLSLDQLRPWIEGDDLHIGVSAALGYHAEIVVQDWETSDIRELRLVNGDVMLTYDFQSVFAGVDAESGESTAHSRTWRKNWFDRVEDALVGIEAPDLGQPVSATSFDSPAFVPTGALALGTPDAAVAFREAHILMMTDGGGEAFGGLGDDVLLAYGDGTIDLLEDGMVEGSGLLLGRSDWLALQDAALDTGQPNNVASLGASLHGGDGNDVLIGGIAEDILIGGAGHDTYVYHLGSSTDWIVAHGGGEDVLEIRTGPRGEAEGWQLSLATLRAWEVGGDLHLGVTAAAGGGAEIVIVDWRDSDLAVLRLADADGVEDYDFMSVANSLLGAALALPAGASAWDQGAYDRVASALADLGMPDHLPDTTGPKPVWKVSDFMSGLVEDTYEAFRDFVMEAGDIMEMISSETEQFVTDDSPLAGLWP